MEYIGDGKILCLTNGANIQYLCTYDKTPFLSLSTGLSLKTECQNGIYIHHSRNTTPFTGLVKMIDFADGGCFIRHTETTQSITFRLRLPPHSHIYRYPDLKSGYQSHSCALITVPMGTPKPEGGSTQSEHRLLITVMGDAVLSEDLHEIKISAGQCTLLFGLGEKGNEIIKMEQRLKALNASFISQTAPYQNAAKRHYLPFPLTPTGKQIWDHLCALTAESGGVLSGHQDTACLLFDQILVGKAFLHVKRYDLALKTANFLLDRFENLGYIPLGMSAENNAYNWEQTENEYMLYPAVSNFLLDVSNTCQRIAERTRIKEAARELLVLAEEAVGTHGFCFTGTEFPMRKNAILPDRLLYENKSVNAEYLYLCSRFPDHKPKIAQISKECYQSDLPVIDQYNRLKKLRLKKTIFGPCYTCRSDARYFGWLIRGNFGSYLCPSCYAKGLRETISNNDPAILPGSYAVCNQNLQKAGILTYSHYCRILEQCQNHIDQICPNASFYETALLSTALADMGAPNYQKFRTQLDTMFSNRNFPFSASEYAVYLLAQTN